MAESVLLCLLVAITSFVLLKAVPWMRRRRREIESAQRQRDIERERDRQCAAAVCADYGHSPLNVDGRLYCVHCGAEV